MFYLLCMFYNTMYGSIFPILIKCFASFDACSVMWLLVNMNVL